MNKHKLSLGRYDYAAYSAYAMYSVASLVIPLMIVAIGRDLDFPIDGGGMSSGGVLHIIRSCAMLITLLLCGWISAFLGKRITMGLSIIMIGAGIFCCSFAPAYWILLPCLLIAGMGEGISEGILTPFVQDLHPESPERYVNIAHSFWSVGIVLAVFSSGVLLTAGVDWRLILAVLGILTMISSLGFLWKENPSAPYPESHSATDWNSIWRATCRIMKIPRFWRCCLAMFFGAGAEFGLTFWAAAYIELTFHTSAWVAGLGVGMIALGMFIGRNLFGYFAKPSYLRYILLFTALGTIPVSLLLALLKPDLLPPAGLFTVLFALLFIAGIGISPYWPTTQVYGVSNLPEEDSTLLYVYFSAVGIPGCGFFSWFMGFIGDKYGLSGALMVVPASLVIFITVIILECWIFARHPQHK
jgi:fucose permease